MILAVDSSVFPSENVVYRGSKPPFGQPSMRGMFWAKMNQKTFIFPNFETFSQKIMILAFFPQKTVQNGVQKRVFGQKSNFFPGGARETEKTRFFKAQIQVKKRENFRKSIEKPPPGGFLGFGTPHTIKIK